MKFKVFRTLTFEKELKKFTKQDRLQVEKFEKKLSENPYVGKALSYVFLREKKLGLRRIYYLIYEDEIIVLMVGTSDKKTQQPTIDAIKEKLDDFYEFVKKNLKNIK